MGHRKEIRVFVSSPGDCNAEREAVSRVLNELNQTVGEREELYFQALRWEDLPPGAGNPQAVIDQHLGEYNVLIGIMWMRFGTPIPGGAGSGTAHEVQQAVDTWKRVGEPRVMFYFKQDPPNEISSIDAGQLQKVQDFKQFLQVSALVQTFHGTSEFESKLRVHLHKLIDHLRDPITISSPILSPHVNDLYEGFHDKFREVVAAQIIPESGSMLHVVFGSIADICEMTVVIPVGQSFDFFQRGPRSVLASFEKIRVGSRLFFDEVEDLWPIDDRPKAAGLGHTKYFALTKNSQRLAGVCFVVTTRDISADTSHYGLYANTPIEGIDYIFERVIENAKQNKVPELALPLLGTGYANVRRTMGDEQFCGLLRQAVTLLAIQKLQDALRDQMSPLRRAVIVIFSRDPQGQQEHDLWLSVTRFLGGRTQQRDKQMKQLLNAISDPAGVNSKVSAAEQPVTSRIKLAQERSITEIQCQPDLIIPDSDPSGVTSCLGIGSYGNIVEVCVNVEIIHKFISELKVSLVAPDGTNVILHNREGSDGDEIRKTYDTAKVPDLSNFLGREIHGTWSLVVVGQSTQDLGRLVRWGLVIRYKPHPIPGS